MIFNTLQEFYTDWGYESEGTKKLFENLTDESLKQAVAPGGRTLGKLAWHITETISEMTERTGLKVFSPDMANYNANSAADIRTCYKHACDSLIEKLKSDWTDKTLQTEDDMYGEKWKRGTTLAILIIHQAHHRAQMTVLMRQAGLKVTGVYGPAKEEWAAMGMEPME